MPRPKSTMPWLEQRDGVWYVFWYNDRKRRTDRLSLRTRDEVEARNRFAAFLTSGLEGVEPPKSSRALTCGAALDHYVKEWIDLKAAVPANHSYMSRWLKAHFGDVPIVDVDIPMCRRYAARRRAGEIGAKPATSDGTIRKELAVLVAAFNHEVAWKRITKNEVPVVELPEAPEGRLRWLRHDELGALRAAATGDVADFIEIAYYTAGRRGSIEDLTVFQVDLDQGLIDLNPPGRKRTRKRKPIIPIFPEIRGIVERRYRAAIAGGGNTLFGLDLHARFQRVVKAAGLPTAGPEKVTPHTLRHTRATHLLMDGVKPYAVGGLLGDSPETVIQVYGHICPDYLQETIAPVKLSDVQPPRPREMTVEELMG